MRIGKLLPVTATLLFVFLLNSPPTRATATEDSTQAMINGSVPGRQRAQALLAMAYRSMPTAPSEAHDHAQDALAFAERAGDVTTEHDILVCLAEAEERMGLFSSCMKTTLRAVQLAQTLGDAKRIAKDLRQLSTAYLQNGMPDRAVQEARNSLAMMIPTQPQQAIDEAQRALIQTLIAAGKHAEVFSLAEVYTIGANDRGDAMEAARLSHLIGRSLLTQHKYADAEIFLFKAERPILSAGTATEQFDLVADLTEASIKSGRAKDGAAGLERCNAFLTEADTWSNRYRLLQLKYELALTERDWQQALIHLQGLKQLGDSASAARLDIQMVHMQASYQLDRKEKDNAELRSENVRKEAEIAGAALGNRLLMSISLVMAVLAVALFVTSRYSLRILRRMKLKNEVIRKQHTEIHTKNMELQRQNMRLAETLLSDEEKEMMLKEIHHRVKNNLQVVDSLLQIQGHGASDPAVDRVVKEAQGRIRSMALVHEHIYRCSGLSNGNLKRHFEHLARNILVAHGAHDRISVSIEAPDLSFPSDTLMPLTLVVNELFTNAVKYAFRDQQVGRISIVLRPAGAEYELLFSDDGIGLGMNEHTVRDRSFGLELVNMLALQLNGQLRFLKGHGTSVCLTFAPDRVQLRAAS